MKMTATEFKAKCLAVIDRYLAQAVRVQPITAEIAVEFTRLPDVRRSDPTITSREALAGLKRSHINIKTSSPRHQDITMRTWTHADNLDARSGCGGDAEERDAAAESDAEGNH